MTLSQQSLIWITGGGAFFVLLLLALAFGDNKSSLEQRLERVGAQAEGKRHLRPTQRMSNSLRSQKDSSIGWVDHMAKIMPNPDKMRARIERTGKQLALGEYILINLLAVGTTYLALHTIGLTTAICLLVAIALGLGVPHAVIGYLGAKRIKAFIATFPEAIDTMSRGIRSGLPITEAISAVGRELPDPTGIEFRRISDGVRLGKTLEDSMWEIERRIDAPEFRFLIVAMAIQRETGGNLAETLGNLSELIRKRRQLRLKVKAMSSEAKASAGIIGSLPFIMSGMLFAVNSEYILTLFQSPTGRIVAGCGLFWMFLGWVSMMKMTNFEI